MKKLFFFLFFSIFLIGLVNAEANPCGNDRDFLGYVKQYSNVSLTQTCDTCTYVNISSYTYPNSTVINLNSAMTKEGIEFNYTFENVSENGCQSYTVFGDKDGVVEVETFDLIVNPTGIAPSDSRTASVSRSIYFVLILGILFFTGFLFVKNKPPVKWTFFILGLFFFLITINILFVGLQDEVVNPKIESFFDKFTAASYYIYWFLGGILAVIWFLTFFQTILFNKNQNAIGKYGGDY